MQHVVYCPRQAALIHVERLWAENRFTAEGSVLHDKVHETGERRARSIRRVTALPLVSRRLGIAGVADLVEFQAGPGGEVAHPVEFKRGRPKAHRADEVQLCAQALCLEEMTGRPVPEGALFYAETKRRQAVRFDEDLRAQTHGAIALLRDLVAAGRTPPAEYRAERCRACSLLDLCRPKATRRSASGYIAKSIAECLDEEAETR